MQLLHVLGAAQQNLVADYYWLQMIQQIGRARTAEEFRDIYPYADLTTDLDPSFALVYAFGATALPVTLSRDHWVNTAESTQLLRKGLQVFPRDSRLRFLLAYNLQYFERRYREAALLVKAMSEEPDSPPYLKALATRLFAVSGDFEGGMALAQTLRDTAPDEDSRNFFDHRVREIAQERILRSIDAALEAFQRREGHLPATVAELLLSGDLATLPEDPLGGSFHVDPRGHAQATSIGHRFELFETSKPDIEP